MSEKEKEGRTTSRTLWPIEFEIVAKTVTKVRKDAGKSRRQLGLELGKDEAYIGKIERQVRSIDSVTFLKLLMLCGTDPSEVVAQIVAEIKKKT